MCILQVPTEQELNMELKPPFMLTSDVAFKHNSGTLFVFFLLKKLLKINTYIYTHTAVKARRKRYSQSYFHTMYLIWEENELHLFSQQDSCRPSDLCV